jgi:hypothetical protein
MNLEPRQVGQRAAVGVLRGDQDSVAGRQLGVGAGAVTVMPNDGSVAAAVPSLTEIAIPEYVPTWVDVGVPVRAPMPC